MKKPSLIMLAALLAVMVTAQEKTDWKARYDRLVQRVGPAGVGVEPVLAHWAEASPDDPDLFEAQFAFLFAKSKGSEVKPLKQDKYLGAKPVLSLKDSTGAPVNYFQVNVFDDTLFAAAMTAIGRAVATRPLETAYIFEKITALYDYEQESPDMASTEILNLIDRYYMGKEAFVYRGKTLTDEDFSAAIQEYCTSFFNDRTAVSMESLRIISARMLKFGPKKTQFLDNTGAYWQLWKKDDKKALKYYKKVLKLAPDDYVAKRNKAIIEKKNNKR